jgi:hypothetical protein
MNRDVCRQGASAVLISVSMWQVDLLHAGFLLGLFFDSEDGGDMFLRNVD